MHELRFSRDWIARSGPKRRQQTTMIFVLDRPALVEFVVVQVAPACRQVGRFRVQGRPGLNRVRFRGRIGRRVLGPGTYRIKARALPSQRQVVDTRLIVVRRVNQRAIASARSADTCTSRGSTAGAGGVRSTGGPAAAGPAGAAKSPSKTAPPKSSSPKRDKGVLGVHFTKKAVDVVKDVPLWLYLLLGVAIALLAVAALPLRVTPNGRVAAALAHRRAMIALAGAAALVAVMVSYALH